MAATTLMASTETLNTTASLIASLGGVGGFGSFILALFTIRRSSGKVPKRKKQPKRRVPKKRAAAPNPEIRPVDSDIEDGSDDDGDAEGTDDEDGPAYDD